MKTLLTLCEINEPMALKWVVIGLAVGLPCILLALWISLRFGLDLLASLIGGAVIAAALTILANHITEHRTRRHLLL